MSNPLVPGGMPPTDNAVIAQRCVPNWRSRGWYLPFLPPAVFFALTVLFGELVPKPLPTIEMILAATAVLGLLATATMISIALIPYGLDKLQACDSVYHDVAAVDPFPKGIWNQLVWLVRGSTHYHVDWLLQVTLAIKNSKNAAEAQHLFCGTFWGTNTPLLVDIELLKRHTLIVGSTGSGKSMRILTTLVMQLAGAQRAVVAYVDMKGDMLVAKTIRAVAKTFGLPFYFFTNDRRLPSMRWNPFIDPVFVAASPVEKSEMLTNAFAVEQGGDYGGAFFAAAMRRILAAAFSYQPIHSFAGLHYLLSWKKFRSKKVSGVEHNDWKDATQALNYVRELAELPQINQTEGKQFVIWDAIQNPGILYFYQSPRVNETSAAILGRLAARMMFLASTRRDARCPDMYLAIDEVAIVIQRALETQLRQARDARLYLITATHNLADLKTKDRDFTAQFLANTAVKFVATARDDSGAEWMKRIGGQVKRPKVSKTTGITGDKVSHSVTEGEETVDRFDQNAINEFDANPDTVLVHAVPHMGFTRMNGPQIITMPWPLWPEKLNELKAETWFVADGDWFILGADLPRPAERAPDGDGEEDRDDDDPPPSAPVPAAPDPVPPKRPSRKEKKERKGPEVIDPRAARLNALRGKT